MKIEAENLFEVNAELLEMIEQAASAHKNTDRGARVSLTITIRQDPKTGAREMRGRVAASLPKGTRDTVTRKLDPVLLLRVHDEVEGQQRL